MFLFGGCACCKNCWDEPEEFVEPASNATERNGPVKPVPTQAASPVVIDPPLQITCRSCNNTGIDIFGKHCACEIGQKLAAKQVVADGHPAKVEPQAVADGQPAKVEPEPVADSNLTKKEIEPVADSQLVKTEPEPEVAANQPEAANPPAEAPIGNPPGNKSLLGPTNRIFSEALSCSSDGQVVSMKRTEFVEGVESIAELLDQLGGGMGSYLVTNTKKLRNSKASASEEDFRAWMRSELPVHAAAGYKGYVDESAWMANLWIWWTLEFFVELFAGVVESTSDMKVCADEAYKKTLYNHQNFFQRTAFQAAMKKLPDRAGVTVKFQGDATPDDVFRDVATFISLGRPLVRYLGEINEEVDTLLQSEKKAKGK